jgi:predicted exporter
VAVLILIGSLLWLLLAPGHGTLVETNIMALLPKDRQNPVAQAAMDKVTGALERKVLFLVEAAKKEDAVRAAEVLVRGLEKLELFSSVAGRVDSDRQQAWSGFYYPQRFQLLTAEQHERIRLEPERQVELVQAQLYSPFSGVTGRELKNDPFLLFRDVLAGMTSTMGSFTLVDGFPGRSNDDKTLILITAETTDSAYGVNGAKQLPGLFALEQEIRKEHGVELYHTGVLFYAAEGIESARNEISTIGIGSLIGVLLLLILIYRSLLPIGLSLLSIGCGLLAAFVVTVWVFGRIHLFSMVFGASLIGISIDYAFHYLTHRLAAGSDWQPESGLRAIFAAITIGLITSLMGYAGLLAAPFPGLQQLAVFSTVGLTAAYATVVCWYPVLAAKPGARSGLPLTVPMIIWLAFWKKPIVRIVFPLLLIGLSVPGFFRARFDDDIRQLQALSPELQAQERAIQNVMGMGNGQQMMLVSGDSEQHVLEKLHAVTGTLKGFVEQDMLTGFQSLEMYLPAESIQRDNFDLVQGLYQRQGAHLQQTLGLSEQPVFDAAFSPLTLSDFLTSPVSEPFRFMWLGVLS